MNRMDDLISRQAAIDFIDAGHLVNPNEPRWSDNEVVNFLKSRPSAEPERKTGRWIETEGLDEEIRCTMCTNPMRSDRGCDGSCQYDEKLYKQIMSIIKDRIDGGGA